MAKTGGKVVVSGELLLNTTVQVNNIENIVSGINSKLNGIKFDDKSTRALEISLGRIAQSIPNLKAKLSTGFVNDAELKSYNAEMKLLMKELSGLERQFRGMGDNKLKFDDSQLEQTEKTIIDIKRQMKEASTALKFDFSGMSSKTDIKEISAGLNQAVKSGQSLVTYIDNLRTSTAAAAVSQKAYVDAAKIGYQEAEAETQALKDKIALYTRLQGALTKQQTTGGPQTTDLTKDLKEARGLDQAFVGLTSNTQKLQVAKTKLGEASTALAMAEANESAKKKELSLQTTNYINLSKQVQNIDLFSANNTAQLVTFDNQVKILAQNLQLNEVQAMKLRDALLKTARVTLDTLAEDLRDVKNGALGAAEGMSDFNQKQTDEIHSTEQATTAFKNKIGQLFGLYNVYQMLRRGIRNAYNDIKQLDQAMNEIAVVTNMTTDQLWGQIEAYMAVAQQYGVATKGVYEVSKLYYQQGRNTAEVTLLTAETLKMAKIAGLDYSKATDNMTVALNGFKLAASDASMIVDVYSKLAAVSAVDTEELAYAMSKTASIAESAGMSFQNTSVFLAQMIETTREAPENIGTAMKTIIARFQEMKKNPLEIIDVEGEEVSFNRVDTALRSIGVSLQDANGQFRDLDGVIYELADKWDTLDRNTQRYIATIVAGSRQQSRFLAMVGDSERLQELKTEGETSEDAGLVQYAKTLDSLESKLNQLKTSFQQFYMSIINGPLVKFFIDAMRWIVDAFETLPTTVSIVLGPALLKIIAVLLKKVGTSIITSFKTTNTQILTQVKALSVQINRLITNAYKPNLGEVQAANIAATRTPGAVRPGGRLEARGITQLPSAKGAGGVTGFLGGITSFLGYAALIASAVSMVAAAYDWLTESEDERVERLKKNIESTKIKAATDKALVKDLVNLKTKHDELNTSTESSNERYNEWVSVNSEILDQYPELLGYLDAEGNQIAILSGEYTDLLANLKTDALKSSIEASLARIAALKDNAAFLENSGVIEPQTESEKAGKIFRSDTANDKLETAIESFFFRQFKNGSLDETQLAQYDAIMKEAKTVAQQKNKPIGMVLGDLARRDALEKDIEFTDTDAFKMRTALYNTDVKLSDSKYDTVIVTAFEEQQKLYKSLNDTRIRQLQSEEKQSLSESVTLGLIGREGLNDANVTGILKESLDREVQATYTEAKKDFSEIPAVFEEERKRFLNSTIPTLLDTLLSEDKYANVDVNSEGFEAANKLSGLLNTLTTDQLRVEIERVKQLDGGALSVGLLAMGEDDQGSETYQIILDNTTIIQSALKDYQTFLNTLGIEPIVADNLNLSGSNFDLLEAKVQDFEKLAKIIPEDGKTDTIGENDVTQGIVNLQELFTQLTTGAASIPKEILTAFDPSSLTGTFDMIMQLRGLQKSAADPAVYDELLIALEDYAINKQQFKYSEIESAEALGKWMIAQDKITKEKDKIYSYEEMGKMLGNGYELSDFTPLGALTKEGFAKFEAATLEGVELYYSALDTAAYEAFKASRDAALAKIKKIDIFKGLVGGLDLVNKQFTIDATTYDKLAPSMQGSFKETLNGYVSQKSSFSDILEQLKNDAATIEGGAALLAESLQSAYQSVVEQIFKSPEDLVKETSNLGGFKDQMTAVALADYRGLAQPVKDTKTGVWAIPGIDSFELLAGVLLEGEINAYNFINVLDESYEGMQGVMRLEEQIAEAREEVAKNTLEGIDDQGKAIAALAQFAKKRMELIFDSNTYNFMSNSPTNDKLAPMYTLFENIQQAQDILAQASKQDGKISLKNFHAMSDYVKLSKKVSPKTLELLENVEGKFDPTLETELTEETVSALGEAIKLRTQEDVDRYNTAVGENNRLVDALKGNTGGELDKDVKFGGDTFLAGVKGEARRLAELVYSTLSVKDSLAVNALAIEMQKRDPSLEDADAFAAALKAYNYDSPELAQLELTNSWLSQIFGILTPTDTETTNEDTTGGELPPEPEAKPDWDDYWKKIDAEQDAQIAAKEQELALIAAKKQAELVLIAAKEQADREREEREGQPTGGAHIPVSPQPTTAPTQPVQVVADPDSIAALKAKLAAELQIDVVELEDTFATLRIPETDLLLNYDTVKQQYIEFQQYLEANPVNIGTTLKEALVKWTAFKNTINNSTLKQTIVVDYLIVGKPVGMAAAGTSGAKGGPTLVGELGPEIRISDNKFNIVGAKGPEITKLKKGDIILNHLQTQAALSGQALYGGTPFDKVTMQKIEAAGYDLTEKGSGGSAGAGESAKTEDTAKAEFDRWYNYLQLIEDIERAVSELQAARENLYGVEYTKSLAREIQMLEQQKEITKRFKTAQETYLANFEATKIKQYGEYLQVVNGVLQIHWDKLNGMESEAAAPIEKVISEWEELKASISDSTQEISKFDAEMKKLTDEMRDTYIDVENAVIEGIKYRQQMIIDNLQKELDMKVKYDNKYLESLRESIAAERKVRERSDAEENRVRLERKLALLKRDTSGKSDLAIAGAEEELRGLNQTAYDQRQDDFVESEENALLAAQEVLQLQLEIQTEVLTLMGENVQLIQETVDQIMASGPENLATFLANWSQEYANSTPTNQTKMNENFTDLAGKVQGYLLFLQNALIPAINSINLGLSRQTSTDPNYTGNPVNPPAAAPTAAPSGGSPPPPPPPRTYTASSYSSITKLTYTGTSTVSQALADDAAKRKRAAAELSQKPKPITSSSTYRPGQNNVQAFAAGGLVNYTGPAIVHGSKRNPEAVLSAKQTGIFQDFVHLLDASFGKSIQNSMVKPYSVEETGGPTTVIVEKIVLEAGTIARDYDARRAGNLVKEEILNIVKYKGGTSLKR